MVFGSIVFGRYLNLGEVMEVEVEPPKWDWCPYKRMQRPEFYSSVFQIRKPGRAPSSEPENAGTFKPLSLQNSEKHVFAV